MARCLVERLDQIDNLWKSEKARTKFVRDHTGDESEDGAKRCCEGEKHESYDPPRVSIHRDDAYLESNCIAKTASERRNGACKGPPTLRKHDDGCSREPLGFYPSNTSGQVSA